MGILIVFSIHSLKVVFCGSMKITARIPRSFRISQFPPELKSSRTIFPERSTDRNLDSSPLPRYTSSPLISTSIASIILGSRAKTLNFLFTGVSRVREELLSYGTSTL